MRACDRRSLRGARPAAAGRPALSGRRARRRGDRRRRAHQRLRPLRRRRGHGGGGGKGKRRRRRRGKSEKVEVAVLNATQEETVGGGEVSGVPGLADKVAKQVVRPAGFAVGEKTDASSGFEKTTIMFEPDHDQEADELAERGLRPARRARRDADDRRGARPGRRRAAGARDRPGRRRLRRLTAGDVGQRDLRHGRRLHRPRGAGRDPAAAAALPLPAPRRAADARLDGARARRTRPTTSRRASRRSTTPRASSSACSGRPLVAEPQTQTTPSEPVPAATRVTHERPGARADHDGARGARAPSALAAVRRPRDPAAGAGRDRRRGAAARRGRDLRLPAAALRRRGPARAARRRDQPERGQGRRLQRHRDQRARRAGQLRPRLERLQRDRDHQHHARATGAPSSSTPTGRSPRRRRSPATSG